MPLPALLPQYFTETSIALLPSIASVVHLGTTAMPLLLIIVMFFCSIIDHVISARLHVTRWASGRNELQKNCGGGAATGGGGGGDEEGGDNDGSGGRVDYLQKCGWDLNVIQHALE